MFCFPLWSTMSAHLQLVLPLEPITTLPAQWVENLLRHSSTGKLLAMAWQSEFPPPLAREEREWKAEEKELTLQMLKDKWYSLPNAEWRIVEGAGGISVPICESGEDWADFAKLIKADIVILVIHGRLGSINQARLTAAYAKAKELPAYLWLNETESQSDYVRASNINALKNDCFYPLLAIQLQSRKMPQWQMKKPWD